MVNGPNYREFALIRLDGENWETGGFAENKLTITKNDDFEDWDGWKQFNRKGYDVTVNLKREGRKITTITENFGILIRNVTTINSDVNTVYLAVSGDQCALTNIRLPGLSVNNVAGRNATQERVRSTVIKVQSNGAGMDSALDMTERLVDESGITSKQKLHLRLLAEELMGMVRSITGEVEAEYWLETEGRNYELYLKSKVKLSSDMKNKFNSASLGNSDVSSKGFMSKLRYIIAEKLMAKDRENICSEWSLKEYKRDVKKNRDHDDEAMEAWDELEKSIIANIADEVKVKFFDDYVEIIVYKNL